MNAATTPNAASQWSSWEQPSPPVSLPGAETAIVPDGSVVFNDHAWDLTPLSKRPTTRWINLNFEHTPERVRDDIKHFIHLVLTVDTPMEQLDRPAMTRRRLTPATVKTIYEDLKPFFTWLADRDVPHLANLTDEDLDDYALQVAAAPVGQNSKARLVPSHHRRSPARPARAPHQPRRLVSDQLREGHVASAGTGSVDRTAHAETGRLTTPCRDRRLHGHDRLPDRDARRRGARYAARQLHRDPLR